MREYGNNHKTPTGASVFAFKGFCAIGKVWMLSANPGRTVREFEREFTPDHPKSISVGQIIPLASISFIIADILKHSKSAVKLPVCGDLFGGEWFRR